MQSQAKPSTKHPKARLATLAKSRNELEAEDINRSMSAPPDASSLYKLDFTINNALFPSDQTHSAFRNSLETAPVPPLYSPGYSWQLWSNGNGNNTNILLLSLELQVVLFMMRDTLAERKDWLI
jgi:hypothetical protein